MRYLCCRTYQMSFLKDQKHFGTLGKNLNIPVPELISIINVYGLWLLGKSFSAPFHEIWRCYHIWKAKQTSLLLREGHLFPKGPKCYCPFRNEF